MSKTICVHFVGVAADQYHAAVKIWGKPDFTHGRATWSCMGEISGDDVVILGRGAFNGRKHPSAHKPSYPTE